jgi:hypothetical protein
LNTIDGRVHKPTEAFEVVGLVDLVMVKMMAVKFTTSCLRRQAPPGSVKSGLVCPSDEGEMITDSPKTLPLQPRDL